MAFVPRFKLYESDGNTLRYTFPIVFSANYPNSSQNLIEHSNFRGKGSIIVDGGESAWDLTLQGVLSGDSYEEVIAAIDALESAVALNTPYVLKIGKTVSTQYSYNVKRIEPIQYPSDNLRLDFIEYTIIFRVNSW